MTGTPPTHATPAQLDSAVWRLRVTAEHVARQATETDDRVPIADLTTIQQMTAALDDMGRRHRKARA